jgi:two-component system, response regulator RegA
MASILVVEDDTVLRSQLRFALEEHFSVTEAGNAADGIAALTAEPVDVVILDLGLPPYENTPQEGLKVLETILNGGMKAKAIILTGQKTETTAMEAIKGGAFDYVLKPVSMDKIFFSIERALLFREAEERMENEGVTKVSIGIKVGDGLQGAREEAEKNVILRVLRETNFNVYRSAKILGVKRESLYYFIKKFGLKREDGNN